MNIHVRNLSNRKIGILLLCLVIVGLFGTALYLRFLYVAPAIPNAKKEAITPTAIPFIAKPKTLMIKTLGVTADIEEVGQDKKGNMDVPSAPDTVAWYRLGVLPGEQGNAVLAGHVDDETGKPAIFANLKKITKGDKIYVTDKNNISRTFIVVDKKVYPYDASPIETIFGATTSAQLNLITCQGEWDTKRKTYKERLVVFSQLVK